MQNLRLFVKSEQIKAESAIKLTQNDSHYLTNVMRCKLQDEILIFNGKDGLWLAQIMQMGKKSVTIEAVKKLQEQKNVAPIKLAFAPVKNVRMDFIATKATELGVAQFLPFISQHSVVDKVNLGKFEANIKEAAEQCQRLDVPEILPPVKLPHLLQNLQRKTPKPIIILCDESGSGKNAQEILPQISQNRKIDQEIIIFIGPEGGFAKTEFAIFDEIKDIFKLNLGPRILRADTAIISALTLVQEFCGDFDLKCNFDPKNNS